MLSVADIAAGGVGGVAAEQINKFVEKVRGEEAKETTHFHGLLEEQRDYLRIIADRLSPLLSPPQNSSIPLFPYPQVWIVPDYQRPHFCLFVASQMTGNSGAYTPKLTGIDLYFEIPGAGIHIQSLAPGWNQLDLPPGTEISTADGGTYAAVASFRDDPLQTATWGQTDSNNVALTSVASSATDELLLKANPDRKAVYIFNDSTAILYLSFGASAASLTSYTVQIAAAAFYEMPSSPIFLGQLRGIWAAAAGAARITELS